MSQTPPPPKLVINCPPLCSFHPDKIGEEKADVLRALREGGAGVNVFTRQATEVLGRPVVDTSTKRHFKHYRLAADETPLPEPGVKVPHIQILEEIIQAGFRNSKTWKPSIKDTLDAIKEFRTMTGGSAFEDMLDAMAAAAGGGDDDGEEEEEEESVEAVLSEPERESLDE